MKYLIFLQVIPVFQIFVNGFHDKRKNISGVPR